MPSYELEVILVPGLTGSYLTGPPAGPVLTKRVWPSPVALALGGLRALRLPVPGEGDGPWLGPAVFPGYPIGPYYGHLTYALRRAGWTVRATQSDWRKPIIEDARRLAGFVERRGGDHPLYFVVHSRGGLVLRKALELLDQGELRERGVRVVAMGVPHYGSLNAVEALFGQDQLTRQLQALGRNFPGGVSRGLGLETIVEITRSWPSVYELLPKPGSSWMDEGTASDLYMPTVYDDSPLEPVPAYLTAAKMFWAGLQPIPSFVEWYDIVGDGFPTWGGVPDVTRLAVPKSMTITKDGDGTVAYGSASYADVAAVATPTAHDALPLDGRLFPYINTLLLHGTKERFRVNGKPLEFGFLKLAPLGRV